MIGKPLHRVTSSRASDMHSVTSFSSMRTMDRERLRDKARQMQMAENLRLAMCARLQQKMRKSPKVAGEMASEVLKILRQRGLPAADLSDAELAEIVNELTSRRQKQISMAAHTARNQSLNNQEQVEPRNLRLTQNRNSGRRSSQNKERSNNAVRHAKADSRDRGASSTEGSTNQAIDNVVDDDRYLSEAQLQQKSVGFSLPPRASPKKERDNGIWEEIVKFSSFEEQMEAQRVKERKLRERREYTSKLEAQVAQKRQATQQERERSAEYHRQTLEKIRQAEDEERRKEQERLEREHQLIVSQTKQRLAKQSQMDRERAIKKAQELHAAEMLEKQRKDDLAREKARKDAEKRRVEQVFLENEAQLEQKRQHQVQERELELKLAEEYIAMEQRKDEARRKQIETMAENIKKKMKIFDDTAKASNDAKAREEDEREATSCRRIAQSRATRARKRRAAAESRSLAQQEQLRLQMKEKKEREEALKRDLNKQADLWKQERVEAERREKLAKQQRAMKNRSQQDVLLQQMREREHRSLQADQTKLEVQLNSRLLEKIHLQAGVAQSQAEGVVSETQNRSRELQEQEQELQHRNSQRAVRF
ncbi:Trichohyalin-like protein [Phytophthora palmivora]|uniref:Trichohyalin-like protein n=1 Tax=Phytophthora palmivora TaxID=4796 RepID=A0A2P4YR54_9STRA|nr:Trichohyalin-like protein [Phytophthora palmivora]